MYNPISAAYIATMQRFNPVHPWFEPFPTIDYHKLWAALKQRSDKAETYNIDELLGIKLNHYKMDNLNAGSNAPLPLPEKTTGLDFTEAMAALADGHKVRLPEWTGYWFMQGKDIKVFSRTGEILDTPNWKHYAMREDWAIVTTGQGFDFALLALKAGKPVTCGLWPYNTYLRLQLLDANSKMTLPYLYITSWRGVEPHVLDSAEIMDTSWQVYTGPENPGPLSTSGTATFSGNATMLRSDMAKNQSEEKPKE